jgi:Tol biopolymer transport system component
MEIFKAQNWDKTIRDAGSTIPSSSGPPVLDITVDLAKPESRLTDNNAYDAEGAYSPDGKWIVFSSRRTGDSEIWVMKSDGSSPVQITKAKGYDGGPFFAPDGKRIVYRSDRKGNDLLQVFVADLAFDAEGNVTGMKEERQLTDDDNVNWGPYWHPDGKHLVYATSAHGHQNYELYTIRDDGSHPVRITHSEGFDGLPVFSPDGKWLMWSSKRTADKTTQLFLAPFTPPSDW